MEWVEFTARTVEEAKELALDRLMVAAEDAEFEVLEAPRPGLFGRVRGEARVRARVRPTPVRQKLERRDRRRGRTADGSPGGDSSASPAETPESGRQADVGDEAPAGKRRGRRERAAGDGETVSTSKEQEHVDDDTDGRVDRVGDEAQRFVAGLIDAFGLQATTSLHADGTDLEITVEGEGLGLLVGPRGQTLQAVQDLARVASQRRLHDHDTRLRVDIGGYRKRRSESLARFVTQVAADVTTSGVARVLDPMSSADRKVIHDTLTSVSGITTRSEGEEPFRRVVIVPAGEPAAASAEPTETDDAAG